jgi:aspartate racemase
VAGRNQLVGHCVSLLPLRVRVEKDQSFGDYLRSRRTAVLDAYEHQQLTFGSLLKKLPISRDASRIPLVPVTFNLDQPLTGEQLHYDGLDVEVFSNPRYFESFEIAVNASEAAGRLVLECQYNTNLFDAATIRRRLEEFEVLLTGIAADPNQAIAKLSILTEAEQKLLVHWNDTQAEYPQDKCIHQLFEARVEQMPDAVAVVFADQQLTYRELNARANQLARYLRSLGVGPEVLVGICIERSLSMLVGLLGILKAGGAYVPLDPTYPKDRLAFIIEDSQVPVLLTAAHLVEFLPENQARLVYLDTDREIFDRESADNLTLEVTPDNLAYVIYTSGSTGRPKGVAIEHHSPVALIDWAREIFTAEHLAGVLAATSICFDLSVFELFVPLSWGGKVILAQNALSLPTLPAADEVTLINTVPSAIAELLRVDGIPASVRVVNLAGEPLPHSLVQQLYKQDTIEQVFNLYGPSEDTTYSTFTLVKKGDSIVTIGRPIANTRCWLLDARMQPVPIGLPGEVYISGVGLARGYLNRPELTAERFIPNPFNQSKGSDRLYKTGDLARYLPDGNIEFLGRIDHQVKIRGFRIELGEIESVLSQHPAVREAVAIAREDVPGNKRLVAYLVAKQEPAPTMSDLRRFLKERLPEYMVPSAFVFLDTLPLTPNGKVDRRTLPAPEMARLDSQDIYVAPRNPVELQLAEIWEKMLGVQRISIADNFFELGGHSLLAVQLLTEIEKAFNKKLPSATIFQAPTVEQLAGILHQPEWSTACPSMVVIQPGTSQPPLFCIHVLGRGLEFYRPLVSYLERSQPVYGLSTQIMDDKQGLPNRVEDLAGYYIKEIRTIQPEGPYLLLGVSFGGTVAFEIARQLHTQGQKVALLGLLDTYGLDANKLLPKRGFFHHALEILRFKPSMVLEKVKANLMGKIEELDKVRKRIQCKLYWAVGRPLPIPLQNFTHREENAEALKHYVPQVYPGRVTLFKAMDTVPPDVDPELGWGELAAGGIEIHEVPNDHLGMLREPGVQILAEKLKACLDQALQLCRRA